MGGLDEWISEFTREGHIASYGVLQRRMAWSTTNAVGGFKIWGRATVIKIEPVLIGRVRDRAYPAKIERGIRSDVKTWDLNCRQQLPKLVPQQRLDQLVADYDARMAVLQARYDGLAMMFVP